MLNIENAKEAPVSVGERIVVNGNLQPYAEARVVECIFVKHEARWAIVLEWPNAPGGVGYSRVWDNDEGTNWFRYSNKN